MPLFDYNGRADNGQKVSGQLEAGSRDLVAGQLLGRGVTPISIEPHLTQQSFEQIWQQWRCNGRIEAIELVMFSRQMYTITKAGIPLIKGIRGLAASLQNLLFKNILNEVADYLQTGMELSTAMRHFPDIFGNLYISLIHVGENSGRLDEVFMQLAEYLERDLETKKSILSALRYPSFVMLALTAAMVVVNIFVIPVFAEMFKKFGADLPVVTKILIGTSNFFVNYWYYLLIFTVAAVYFIRRYIQSDEGSRVWGRYKMRVPLVGDLIERASMARYTRSLGLMLKSGLPLPQSLQLCSKVIDNPFLADKIIAIREGVERGESLYRTHENSHMLTPLVMQMISVGEESGQVDTLLAEVAEFYEREVDYDLKSLSAKIEPIMIVIMAIFVGILAMGIFLPMWNLYAVQA